MGKITLDSKTSHLKGHNQQSNDSHKNMRDYSPMGEISKSCVSHLNLKSRLHSQFERGKEYDQTSDFSNVSVPMAKPEHREQRRGKAYL